MPPESLIANPEASKAIGERPEVDEEHLRYVAKLVYSELVTTNGTLTAEEICKRTLLPQGEVREAITALVDRGLCRDVSRQDDPRPSRYFASR